MDRSIIERPGEDERSAEPSEDLTADLLRLTAAIVSLVTAIVLGVVR